MSWRATVPCSRAQAEAICDVDDMFGDNEHAPVLVADEPDPTKPNAWLIHAYFEKRPSEEQLAVLMVLGKGSPQIEQLADEDWVRISQAGLEPVQAGRFYIHTPLHDPDPDRINFEIDAGLAFGTGQHATTEGCLEVLDALERSGRRYADIADIGTGTGLLAFAALSLWPDAYCLASDIDDIAIDVARDNAAINRVSLGSERGQLLLVQATGVESPLISARAPFDLLIANILAAPLIDLAPDFSKIIGRGGSVILAGLLDSQADSVTAAYEMNGFRLAARTSEQWPVLVLQAQEVRLATRGHAGN